MIQHHERRKQILCLLASEEKISFSDYFIAFYFNILFLLFQRKTIWRNGILCRIFLCKINYRNLVVSFCYRSQYRSCPKIVYYSNSRIFVVVDKTNKTTTMFCHVGANFLLVVVSFRLLWRSFWLSGIFKRISSKCPRCSLVDKTHCQQPVVVGWSLEEYK